MLFIGENGTFFSFLLCADISRLTPTPLILSASSDNANRLWDLRYSLAPIQTYKSHQNTSKMGVCASFGPKEQCILGGSEDGIVYLWNTENGQVVNTLKGHKNIVYKVKWNGYSSLLASCGEDCLVKTWSFDFDF